MRNIKKFDGITVIAPADATNIRFRFNRFLTYRMNSASHVSRFNEPHELIRIKQINPRQDEWDELCMLGHGSKMTMADYEAAQVHGNFEVTLKKL